MSLCKCVDSSEHLLSYIQRMSVYEDSGENVETGTIKGGIWETVIRDL